MFKLGPSHFEIWPHVTFISSHPQPSAQTWMWVETNTPKERGRHLSQQWGLLPKLLASQRYGCHLLVTQKQRWATVEEEEGKEIGVVGTRVPWDGEREEAGNKERQRCSSTSTQTHWETGNAVSSVCRMMSTLISSMRCYGRPEPSDTSSHLSFVRTSSVFVEIMAYNLALRNCAPEK
ncbi:Hypothetical predicted protein [Podarcis lilfordi]|uniref:Uncharacterized protein n=1 Tax=Podarcis lilfordi TaxID=74358 RepID=A0AA35KCF2_9SAUR|nr:Hypothetical predicted protein [Podarcis lilfordi]